MEENGLARERYQNANIHWVAHMAVEAAHHQMLCGYRGHQRPPAHEDKALDGLECRRDPGQKKRSRQCHLPPRLRGGNAKARDPQGNPDQRDPRPAEYGEQDRNDDVAAKSGHGALKEPAIMVTL